MPKEIFYISIILWFLPLISNFKKKYFVFFVFTALADPIGFLIFYSMNTNANFWFIANKLLIIYFFYGFNFEFRKKELIIIAFFILFVFLGFPTNILVILLNTIIMFYFLNGLIENIKEKSTFNIFVFMLFFYELTLILKALFSSNLSSSSDYYYYYTIISMFAFAIFFTFTNEKSKFLQVNINKYLAKEDDD